MRLRSCLLIASAAGAGGALYLASDMYRHLQAARNSALLSGHAAAGDLSAFFGMVHVLGTVALAFLFFALFLLISISPSTASEKPPPAPQRIPEAEPLAESPLPILQAEPQEREPAPTDEPATLDLSKTDGSSQPS